MSDNALATVKDTQLAHYGEREVVRELVDRLMAMHPAASDVGAGGMRAAAQLAILIGASPLPSLNEIHIWKDNQNGKDRIHVEPGINYWRRRAEQKGGVRWSIQARPMNEQERRLYGIPDSQLAAICRGVRADEYAACRAEGMTFSQADEACGFIGIAVVNKTEYAKNGRPVIWTAIKRAQVDFFRQAFPIIPGEILAAGAGMKQVEGRFEPDFTDAHWDEQRDRPELPPGASVDWLRDEIIVEAEHEPADDEVLEENPIVEHDEQPAGPEWEPDSLITDIRAALEESDAWATGAVCDKTVDTGLYKNRSHALNAAKGWPEFETAGIEVNATSPLRQETALRLFDWLVARKGAFSE